MLKFDFELKKKIVDEYRAGEGSLRSLGAKYNVSPNSIHRWVLYYQRYGTNGLRDCQKKKAYSFAFKLRMVELYLTGNRSYQEIAFQEGMMNAALIVSWVKEYNARGPEALRSKEKGKKLAMNKDKIIQAIKNGDSEEQKELLEKLQEENLHLKIENAFLKEARRLRLEEEKLLNELRESSTASEENSN